MGAHSRLAARPAGGHLQRAHDGIRTRDLFLTKEVLYRLSYVSATAPEVVFPRSGLRTRTPGFARATEDGRPRPPSLQQVRRESNPQPPVLETGALPIELLTYTAGGQGGNRTPDTAIFSRMLYQLSYLAPIPLTLRPVNKKPPGFGGRPAIAGAGFEPATFGL